MPSPNPVTFSKAASTNQQINSKLIYRRTSGLPEQAEDSSSIVDIVFVAINKMMFDEYKPSLVLENKASVARDHLANERTFLAWLRTSLSFVGIGVAVTQLFRLKGESSFGIVRYFHSQYLMTTGHFPASRGSVLVGTILTILSLTACFLVIIIDN
ncbi:751_t:CDS:2 [Funneliformis mosseae]|uniref:751_t:CDS:1 n=1 Tax=Funneliformis mosseae TaxID=27381 RepID=A0A9N9FT27_FUNMO|nr:751_t:CDS:2 [Funneliformis mosseae]